MKFLTIVITLVYFHSSNALFENLLEKLKIAIPPGFNISNVKQFKGFDSMAFDGKSFNPFQHDPEDIFRRFKVKHNKNYTKEESPQRKANLVISIEAIAKKIIDFESKGIVPTFKVGLNGLADKSVAEYRKLCGNREILNRTVFVSDRQKRSTSSDAICKPNTTTALPTAFDWRQQNIVTPVKDQKSCGCCWAFASTATIESLWVNKTKQTIDLSEQDLVNCASTHGCDGDSPDTAFSYVKTYGQAKEASAPYTATVGQCKHVNAVQINDYCRKGGTTHWTRTWSNGTVEQWDVTEDNPDDKIRRDLMENGPLVVAINANDLQHYSSGVYDFSNCPTSTNHAITLVGWGTQNGVNYWICKNSWSASWGESGYFRIVRGKNMCGFNAMYYYPIMSK